MDSEKPSSAAPLSPEGSSKPRGLSRRQLLRGGSTAAPVLLSFASSPVSATSSCLVASSFVSATVYKSRSGGTNNVTCISTTVGTHCARACAGTYQNLAPHCNPLSTYFSTGCTFPTMSWGACDLTTLARVVFRNNGTGLASSGDIAILQRLIALADGAPTVFTKAYCTQVWNARNNASALTTLVGTGNGTWDSNRLLAWLEYSASNVNF